MERSGFLSVTLLTLSITATLLVIGGQILGFFVNWNVLKEQNLKRRIEDVKK